MTKPARLRSCDLARCEGMCCHDGAWLTADEAASLRKLVFRRRAELPEVPDRFLESDPGGMFKTATRPHAYRNVQLPAHFTPSRCVFALPDARCSLQVLAEADGVHRWTYKPRVCWMHPLRESATGPLAPPADPAADWDRAQDYPGFTSFTHCGRNDPDGLPWEEALSEELARWQAERT